MSEINFDRLEELADFVEKIPPDHFNYRQYWKARKPSLITEENHLCPSVGCILGSSLQLFYDVEGVDLIFHGVDYADLHFNIGEAKPKRWYAYSNLVFGLAEDQHDYLFTDPIDDFLEETGFPDFENTPEWAAMHLREFIEDHKF